MKPIISFPSTLRIVAIVVSFAILLTGTYLYKNHLKTFETHAQATDSFIFTANGDIKDGPEAMAGMQSIIVNNAQFHLALGDLSYGSLTPESSWCDYVHSNATESFPYMLIAGNHEDDGPAGNNINGFIQCLPDHLNSSVGSYGKEYYFDYPASNPLARFILISPNLNIDGQPYDYDAGTARYDFVSNTIDAARSQGIKWIIVGMHQNCISVGVKSCQIGQDVFNLLLNKRVDLILQGHDHNYQRSKQLTCATAGSYNPNCVADSDNNVIKGNGSILTIAGMGGNSLYSVNASDSEAGYFAAWNSTAFGVIKFTVSTNAITGEFIRVAGGTFTDTFTITDSVISTVTPDPETPTNTPTSTPLPSPTSTPTPTIDVSAIDIYSRVNMSADDAEESISSKSVNLTSSDLELGTDSSAQIVGMRFTNLTVPQGATIISANIEFEVDEITTNVSSYIIRGQASDNAPTFTSSAENLSIRPKTLSQVPWTNVSAWSTIDAKHISPNIAPIIQEIVDRTAWQSGSALAIFIDGSGKRTAEAYNGEPAAAPLLKITFSTVPSATPTPTIDPDIPTPTNTPVPTDTPIPAPSPTPTITPTPASITIINPIADAYVRANNTNSNYGTQSFIEIDGSPIYIGYLKFNLNQFANSTIVEAKLRVRTTSDASSGTQSIKSVADTSWGETTIRYSNRPPLGTLLGSFAGTSKNTVYEIDITPYVSAMKGQLMSIGVEQTNSNGVSLSSREATSANRPVLVITTQ